MISLSLSHGVIIAVCFAMPPPPSKMTRLVITNKSLFPQVCVGHHSCPCPCCVTPISDKIPTLWFTPSCFVLVVIGNAVGNAIGVIIINLVCCGS